MAARLGGRYELGMVLGVGGMARVYAASDLVLGRQVAVKVLDPALARDPEYVARFAREARTAAMLPPHSGIVAIYDSGQDADAVYLVMELVNGRTVAQAIAANGRLEPSTAARIAIEACQALAVAHGAGLVHRDIKPANIMLTDTGAVKVVDFGIARAQSGDALTRAGAVLGSPSYMAPEQATGSAIDARTDLYALGIVLYEMLTGAPPFAGDDQFAVLTRQLNEVPAPPSALVPGIPVELDRAVAALLAKDPNQRPATAEQAAYLIADAAHAQAPGTGRTTVALAPHDPRTTRLITAVPPASGHRGAPEARDAQRRNGLVAALIVGAVALVGAGIWALSSGSTPAPSAADTPTGPVANTTASSTGAGQITVPTTSVASPTATSASPSPSKSPSATVAITGPSQALTALRQTVAAQAAAGALKANAKQSLDNEIQNMRQQLTQAQVQASQNPQNQTQIVQNLQRQFTDQIKNMRQQLASYVQHREATPAASTAINSALNKLQQTIG